MATGLSGTLSSWTESNSTFAVRVNWSETYDIATNTSTVAIDSIQVRSSSYYQWIYYPNGTIKIDGQTVKTMNSATPTGSVSIKQTGTWYTISNAKGSLANIEHGADGKKSISIALSLKFYTSSGSGGSGWSVTGTNTIDLTEIPRTSSITSASNITLGDACNITWIPSASSFGYKITFGLSSWSYTTGAITPNTTSSYSYTGYKIPIEVSNQIINASTGTMTATLYTYSDSACSNLVGSSSTTFVVTVPSNIIPTISSVVATIDNSANSIINNWNVAVAGYTKVKIVANASGSYGSTISSFTISGGYSVTQAGTSLSYTGGVITSSGSKTFTVVATDSRSRKSSSLTSNSITFYSYSKPNVSGFTVSRSDADKSKVSVRAVWTYSSINGNNSANAILYYKLSSSSSWTAYGYLQNNVPTELGTTFNETSSYNFRVVVTDSLSQSSQDEAFISTIKVLMDFRAGGNGLGIGKIAESDNLEIAFNTIFMGDIYIRDGDGHTLTLDDYIRQIINST